MTSGRADRQGDPALERLRRDGEAFMQALSREYYEAHAGLKETAELQPIYARFASALDADVLALVREAFLGAGEGSEERRQARLLLDWQVEAQSARRLAALDEREMAWEASAHVRTADAQSIPYQRAAIAMANAVDRPERLEIERARAALVERELAPIRRERFQREHDITNGLELGADYNATFELLSGVSLNALQAECTAFLADTRAMWDESLPYFLKRGLGIAPHEATRADALALFRAREFDPAFRASAMEPAIVGQVREMGIDPFASGRVRLDTGEREGKRARAFCAPVRVPDEVYLVLRPHGGQTDWQTFLHELGHALHFAHMRPDLPFEYRWLGDNSVTEAYAMLFDHLMQDGGWLRRYTDLGTAGVPPYLRMAGFVELHYLRRYCAKLSYEIELHGERTGWDSLPDLYVDMLTSATTFQYARADAFVDVDPRFYAVRYLRAWQLQALIAETLVSHYDVDWWRNPRAGPWITESLFGEGQRELAHEQADRVTGKALGFAPLVRAIEGKLS